VQASERDIERAELFGEADRPAGSETALVDGMERAKEAVGFGEIDFDDVFLTRSEQGRAGEEQTLV
jgi:hypothetical protein